MAVYRYVGQYWVVHFNDERVITGTESMEACKAIAYGTEIYWETTK